MKLLPSAVAFIAGCAMIISNAVAQTSESEGIWNTEHVQRAVLTSAVENREPVDDLATHYTIPADAVEGQVSLFTHLIDHADNDITHLWFYGNQLEAEVALRVGSNFWRTYSTKRIPADQTGQWRVLVVDSDQDILLEFNFTVSRDQ